MRVALIGAGIVGVTTAYELSADGHEVTVFERRAAVAAEASFANAGVIAPGWVGPWAGPGMRSKVLAQSFSRHRAVRFGAAAWRLAPWMWRWWRACKATTYRHNREAMQRLAHYSGQHLHALAQQLSLEFEHRRGCLVLLRSARELASAQAGLQLLRDLGVGFELVDATQARRLEPGLSTQTALAAAVHLPQDGVGNCRLFAHLLKTEAQRLGARFCFEHEVLDVQVGRRPQLAWRQGARAGATSFDAVVVCAGTDANNVLQRCGIKLPLAPVHGYSITAPLRHFETATVGPVSAVMDERYKVALSRLGQRVRVAGTAELGGAAPGVHAPALATLYRALDDWFPGAAQLRDVQVWKGARPMLPDGPPVLGACAAPGVWLNLGHGASGWALACGSARVLADLIGGRKPAIDLGGLGIERLLH